MGRFDASGIVAQQRSTCAGYEIGKSGFDLPRRLLLAVCVGLFSVSAVQGDDSNAVRTLLMGPIPVILEFDITIEAGTIDAQREQMAAEFLERCDKDGDALLTLEEAEALEPLPGDRRQTVESIWDQVDTEEPRDQLDADELVQLIEVVVGPTVAFETSGAILAGRRALEAYLDANGDGRIESDEFQNQFASLSRVDFDDDDTISAAELVTLARSAAEPVAIETVFVRANAPEAAEKLVEQAKFERLPSWRDRRWEEVDADGDGVTTAAEARSWLADADADLVVRLDIAPTERNRLKLTQGESRLRPVRPTRSRRSFSTAKAWLGPHVDGTGMEFHVEKNVRGADDPAFLRLQHIVADDDRNGWLTPGEYNGGFNPKPGTFEELDNNNDKMLYVDELNAFLESKQRMGKLQVLIKLEDVSKTLFTKIDSNIDFRLAPREIAMIAEEERMFSGTASDVRITARINEVEFLGDDVQESRMMEEASRPGVIREEFDGPEWFQKMDRNRDGDLTWREFLGPRAAFDRIDTDGDGFVTAREATGASTQK